MSKLKLLQQIADEYGTPCFVYFMDEVYARINSIRDAFQGQFEISYAMKCNPNPKILERFKDRVSLLDISSGGELTTAVQLGWPVERISFTGPGKRRVDLEASINHGIGEVILESLQEAKSLNELADAAGIIQKVCLRIAPKEVPKGFGVKMSGKPCQFGIDEEDLGQTLIQIKNLSNLDIVGFHIYSGTQCLKPDAISENYENFIRIFRGACENFDIIPEMLIFGSGIGIPYHEGKSRLILRQSPRVSIPVLKN